MPLWRLQILRVVNIDLRGNIVAISCYIRKNLFGILAFTCITVKEFNQRKPKHTQFERKFIQLNTTMVIAASIINRFDQWQNIN